MRAEQLAHKLWLTLDAPKGDTVQATVDGASVAVQVCNHDTFSCLAENLSVKWEDATDWEDLLARCEKGLKTLHRDFQLLERDDENKRALFRSPVSRNLYWEALLLLEKSAILTVQRYQPQEKGQRTIAPFTVTEEQLAEILVALIGS
ncbi:MAG: hypothetical protein ACUVTP_05095 [Candidatus Fervidibacter sp.]|uniref:hypothetical protein n=1 Tax=Candidatus Fervidibacter sp. TaxID=3100871 RepID=UPI00404A81CB